MNTRSISLCALCFASPLAFGASTPLVPADTTPELPAISVSAAAATPSIRHDVRATCPDIDSALQASLAPAWGRVKETGTMRVRFRLEGDRIVDASTSGLSWDYRSPVRRAVAALRCAVPAGTSQTFEFLLSIRAPQDASRPGRFALRLE